MLSAFVCRQTSSITACCVQLDVVGGVGGVDMPLPLFLLVVINLRNITLILRVRSLGFTRF